MAAGRLCFQSDRGVKPAQHRTQITAPEVLQERESMLTERKVGLGGGEDCLQVLIVCLGREASQALPGFS